jgi:membrane protease YdiL (CAAX protease family)
MHLPPGLSALLEVGVMFLPAIPAYLWVWPVLDGAYLWAFQVVAYIYVLAGTLFIGLRRWSLDQLGFNRKGIWFSLICGIPLLVGRQLIVFSIDLGLKPALISWVGVLGNILFYIGLVGLVEEFLYRGLVYQAFEEWLGIRWAIWGSSVGFVLWHIFGQGVLVGGAAFFVGLVFALIRWRAGGIIGLIFLHGLYDLEVVLLVMGSNQELLDSLDIGRPTLIYPVMTFIGLALLILVPIYLWRLHPLVERSFLNRASIIR